MGKFSGFSPSTLEFFMSLALNNSKTYFEAHRHEYEEHVLQPMRDLAFDLAAHMLGIDQQFDARPVIGGTISRIYRDARRVRGGPPYRDYMWLSYRRKTEGNKLGFYYDVSSRGSALGLGIFEADAAYMNALRLYIKENGERYRSIRQGLTGFTLFGDEYKRPPVSSDDPVVNDILKRRLFYFDMDIPIEMIFQPSLPDELAALFTSLKPMYDYMRNGAININGDESNGR